MRARASIADIDDSSRRRATRRISGKVLPLLAAIPLALSAVGALGALPCAASPCTAAPDAGLAQRSLDSTSRAQDSIMTSAFMALAKDSTLVDEYQKILGIYKARKQYEQELLTAQHMISAAPSSAMAYYSLADAELDNGDPDEAIKALSRALVIEPSFPKALVLMAEAHTMNKASDSALVYLNRAIALNPRYAQAHIQRATLLSQLGRDAEAIESFRAASELLPDSYDAWFKYARALVRSGDSAEAVDVLRYVISLDEGSADAHYLFAQACAGAGRKDEAIAAYKEFFLHFPRDSRALEAERAARALGWNGP